MYMYTYIYIYIYICIERERKRLLIPINQLLPIITNIITRTIRIDVSGYGA